MGVPSSAGLQVFATSGSMMSCCSPRNVIVAEVERVPFAARCERLPVVPERRLVNSYEKSRPSVSLRVFTVREVEGS